MRVNISEFLEFFGAIYKDKEGKPIEPFPWQVRLANRVFENGWPACIDLPTASGKTSAIDVAVFVLACQAGRPTNDRTVGRRIFFTVNRRVIVDEAHERAIDLAKQLLEPGSDIVARVADALRSINADKSGPPLDVTELRGGIYRDRRWARSITQPMVVATTADQLGSRLLFRGYGVSPTMQPIHAALTACDSLILLDEAHVTRAFAQTLDAISQYRAIEKFSPPVQFVQMTATPAGDVKREERFTLEAADLNHPILSKRQNASKPAQLLNLAKVKHEKLVATIADRAVQSVSGYRKAIGVIVNRVQTARDTHAALRALLKSKNIDADVHLVIGRMRPADRDQLTDQLRTVVGPARPDVLAKPCFVIATQCLEVGADYDFDALITECASIDALRQRFGRLNRRGRDIEIIALIVTSETAMKEPDPVYSVALKNTWEWLIEGGRTSVDFGINSFKQLWEKIEADSGKYLDPHSPNTLLSPAPDAAVLLPAHLDALCQTAPPPEPSPDVSYFIHGPQRDNTEVQVCWRADLGPNHEDWRAIVSMLPPMSMECMTAPIRVVRKWMGVKSSDVDADIAMQADEGEYSGEPSKRVLIWRGNKKSVATANPNDLRPGDTLVIPIQTGGWDTLGHIPDAPSDQRPENVAEQEQWDSDAASIDIAERIAAEARRQRVIRIHRGLPNANIAAEIYRYALNSELALSKSRMRGLLEVEGDFREISYPEYQGMRNGILLRFTELLPQRDSLAPPPIDEEDDDDSLCDLGQPVLLDDHVSHVVQAADRALTVLHMTMFDACLRRAAQLHDLGKADVRFQAMLLGSTPYEAALRPKLLGKSGRQDLSATERSTLRKRSQLPSGFRHEMLSVQIVDHYRQQLIDDQIDIEVLLHLIAAHHGHGRPFAPLVLDDNAVDDFLEVRVNGLSLAAEKRRNFVTPHRYDSGICERFWSLTRRHGWWSLAYLETILRLADQQASESEQRKERK